jgi:hypothetical protein
MGETTQALVTGQDLAFGTTYFYMPSGPGNNRIGLQGSVINNGTVNVTSPFVVRFYLSSDAVFGGDYALPCDSTYASLASGQSITISRVCSIPASVPYGYYRGIVKVDATNVITEADEANNVKIDQYLASHGIDLYLHSSAKPYAVTTADDRFRITFPVYSLGTIAPPASTLKIYLSTDAAYSVDDTLMSTVAIPTMDPTGSYSVSADVTVSNTLVGFRYFVAVADAPNAIAELNETNNSQGSAAAIPIGPDLLYAGVSATDVGSQIAVSYFEWNRGSRLAVASTTKYTLVNISGCVLVPGLPPPPYPQRYNCTRTEQALSTVGVPALGRMPTFTGAASYVGSFVGYTLTAPSGPITTTTMVQYNTTTARRVQLNIDSANVVAEASEANSALVTFAPKHDLVPSAPTNSYAAGTRTLTASVSVRNSGTVNAPLSYTELGVALSSDAVLSANDLRQINCSTSFTPPAAGATATATVSCTIAATVTGTYRVILLVDAQNVGVEINEANNVILAPNAVTL